MMAPRASEGTPKGRESYARKSVFHPSRHELFDHKPTARPPGNILLFDPACRVPEILGDLAQSREPCREMTSLQPSLSRPAGAQRMSLPRRDGVPSPSAFGFWCRGLEVSTPAEAPAGRAAPRPPPRWRQWAPATRGFCERNRIRATGAITRATTAKSRNTSM
jgi:hypothetical protein